MSPNQEEVEEYARFLGIDPREDPDLLYIARQGLVEPVPEPWESIQDQTGNIIYRNKMTGNV